MNVIIQDRAFGTELAALPMEYSVQRYSHAAIGGPKTAVIGVTGPELDLWTILDRLRCPVKIYSDMGDCVWWGYVAEVQLTIGGLALAITIDSMYNRVAVAYQDNTLKTRATTAWVSDAASVAEYGTRELLYSSSGSTAAAATAAQTAILNQLRYPIPGITETGQQATDPVATLTCRGWWDTLSWKYYTDAGVANIDTAAQVIAMIAAAGQFIVSTSQEITSSISTLETRVGDNSGKSEIEELLNMGTSNNLRMLTRVDEFRNARLYEEPTNASPSFIDRSGRLLDAFGSDLRSELCPAGIYVRLRDVIPSNVNVTRLADPSLIFIEESEYTPGNNALKITPRGVPSISDIGKVRNG